MCCLARPKRLLQKPAFALYPNPATDQLTVALEQTPNATLTLADHSGRTVRILTLPGLATSTQIAIADLAPGFYTCTVRTGSQVLVKQFVKQ